MLWHFMAMAWHVACLEDSTEAANVLKLVLPHAPDGNVLRLQADLYHGGGVTNGDVELYASRHHK